MHLSLSLSPECSRWMNLNGHSMEDCEEEVVVISKHGIVSNPISIEWQSQAYLKVQSSVTRKCQNPLWFPIRHRSKQIGLVPLERSMKRCSSVWNRILRFCWLTFKKSKSIGFTLNPYSIHWVTCPKDVVERQRYQMIFCAHSFSCRLLSSCA